MAQRCDICGKGRLVGNKLRCTYHGWTYDCAGNGESPGTPKLHACATRFEAQEKFDAVWIRSAGSHVAWCERRTVQ